MAGICFFYEESDVDVWSGKNLDAWNYAAKAAGDIDKLWIINKTNQILRTPNEELEFQVFENLPKLNGTIVKVAPEWECKNGQSLWNFNHQVDWYLFGPAIDYWTGNLYVPQANKAALHSIHIATVVMMHRYGVINGS